MRRHTAHGTTTRIINTTTHLRARDATTDSLGRRRVRSNVGGPRIDRSPPTRSSVDPGCFPFPPPSGWVRLGFAVHVDDVSPTRSTAATRGKRVEPGRCFVRPRFSHAVCVLGKRLLFSRTADGFGENAGRRAPPPPPPLDRQRRRRSP